MTKRTFIRPFREIGLDDIALVGGKNASLGEMIQHVTQADVHVPEGFALTTDAYWLFWRNNNLALPVEEQLRYLTEGHITLQEAGSQIRGLFFQGKMPEEVTAAVREAYGALCDQAGEKKLQVAIRSSATAEDLPEASFAGQQESFLNVRGGKAVVDCCQRCFASLFTNRAISYRNLHGIDHMKVALSVGVQMMVRSDKACSGVMFSLDTETGFPEAILINATWGLGEGIVSGTVDPDEYMVFKPFLSDSSLVPIILKRSGQKKEKVVYAASGAIGTERVATSRQEQADFVLTNAEIISLSQAAKRIEAHYTVPMDMEWAKDFRSGQFYIVQARPETVQSKKKATGLWTYQLKEKGPVLTRGLSIGDAVATGKVCILKNISEADNFPKGAVLVAPQTDPDWLPVMRKASALITEHGGRTSHAAIVSRELGLPAVIGTGNACQVLQNGQEVTVSCAEGGEGMIYEGILAFEKSRQSFDEIPPTVTKVMLNMANPDAALRWWRLPADGIGLARMEFIISNHIKIHPMALLHPDRILNTGDLNAVEELTRSYDSKAAYFVEKLALDIALIAASQYPKPVIVRLSDFKTNEYADLLGGAAFEPRESNPMIGWRGASRYYDKDYREAFSLECKALKRVRDTIGFKNVVIMVPFCRTMKEADRVLDIMAQEGLKRGQAGLEIYVMAEIPSNIILAEEFAERFDGFSIGSNDLTQLTLGIDRDSDKLSPMFDAADPAVLTLIRDLITRAHKRGTKVGLCGQAPSDDPDYAKLLIEAGIDTISVTPDSFLSVKNKVFTAEREIRQTS
ncbi:phosphoenolpyruvate synthase [Paremcibacter congregatus]|uniref:Phosphoenolpyruvate synthase n=1 Tax=Paremcibacter congregatus TaxID=2043170 RepID=A0A2G4YTV7_9PROT|nr:phosphoenolpyruvate synthase [Paremcibacter congregatus]PHZ85779.1 phosphoenolpyruvate synthase [Paremcibacter congregatus]QDE26740.1 phosphoenolpyruvate synthase [Paremcibacter congregatus]